MWSNAVQVSDDPALNGHIDVDATPLWQSWPGNNRPVMGGRMLCGPDQGVIGFNVFLIVILSLVFQIWVAARLHPLVNVGEILLVILTLYALGKATWTEAGILPRQSFQRLQHEYARLPIRPGAAQVRMVAPDGQSLVQLPEGTVEVDSSPIEIDPTTGDKSSLKFCSTCKIFRPTRAKHCRDCDVCVEEFDHHCPWVCNCVGKRNYRFFVGFVIAVTLTTAYVCLCCIVLIAREASDSSFSAAVSAQPVAGLLTLFTFMLNWCLCSLSCYHVWLIGQDLTTNEHIKQQRLDDQRRSTGGALGSQQHRPLTDVDHDDHHHETPDRPRPGCVARFWKFFCVEPSPSSFDLKAPLGRSIFVRTLYATSTAAREAERRDANLMPTAQPVLRQPLGNGGVARLATPEELPLANQASHVLDMADIYGDSGSHSYTPSPPSSHNGRRGLAEPSQQRVIDEEPFDFVQERRFGAAHQQEEDEKDDDHLHTELV